MAKEADPDATFGEVRDIRSTTAAGTRRLTDPAVPSTVKASRPNRPRRVRAFDVDPDYVVHLIGAGCSGRDWDAFIASLCEDAADVIASWARTGQLSAKVQARRLGALPRTTRYHDPSEARSLANETVAAALAAFRNGLLGPGGWDPTRGASFGTFFLGQCLLQVRNIYRRGLGESGARQARGAVALSALLLGRPCDDPAGIAADRDELRRAFEWVTADRDRQVVILRAAGQSDRAIAANTGLQVDAVRKVRYRIKKATVAMREQTTPAVERTAGAVSRRVPAAVVLRMSRTSPTSVAGVAYRKGREQT